MISLQTTAVEFDIIEKTGKEISVDQITIDFDNKNKIYWIHCDLNEKDKFREIIEKFNMPDYLVALCNNGDTSSRVIDVIDAGNALTLQVPCIISERPEDMGEENSANLILYLTETFCFTAAPVPLNALEQFKTNYQKNIKYAQTPGFILFLVLDNVINSYSIVLQEFEFLADKLELSIRETHGGDYNDVMGVKNHVMKIKRYASSLRDVLMRISGRKIAVISEEGRLSLVNLFDHAKILVNEADAIRDILNSSLNLIDNALMQKLNETMRVLTAFAAIFLPLSVIAGIYGMNFRWLPELEWKYGYFFALGLMILCAISLLYLFKKKKWF